MMKKTVRLVGMGIGWGCTISCIVSMIGVRLMGAEWIVSAPRGFSMQIIAAMLVGVAWAVPSLVYDNEKLSRLQQIVIHFGIAFPIYFLIASYMGWMPMGNVRQVIGSLAAMIGFILLVWSGFYLYYRGETRAINKKIEEKNEAEKM